jgi:hypothetical protein
MPGDPDDHPGQRTTEPDGSMEAGPPPAVRRRCQEHGCHRAHYARGWCGMHYKRWLRTGSPIRGERPRDCEVDGCDGQAKSRGWCHAHYQRWRTHGDVLPDVPVQRAGRCGVEGCDRQRYARHLCNTHYRRWLQTGDARPQEPIRVVTGEGYEHHGYWVVPVPKEDRWLVGGLTQVGEHRLVMARQLGRPLDPDESVHHINGVRTDNRLANLELWSSSHPSGQRVADKVAWAHQLLARYAPALLADETPKRPGRTPEAPDGCDSNERTPDQI